MSQKYLFFNKISIFYNPSTFRSLFFKKKNQKAQSFNRKMFTKELNSKSFFKSSKISKCRIFERKKHKMFKKLNKSLNFNKSSNIRKKSQNHPKNL